MEQIAFDFFKVKVGDRVIHDGDVMTVKKCSKEWFMAIKDKDSSAMIFRYIELGHKVFKE